MAFGFGFALTAIAKAVGFTPLSLFAANEPGVWYDPSDLTTLYQDAAGTTPVTAVEQPVGLMLDKSKGLVLGSEAANLGAATANGGTLSVNGATAKFTSTQANPCGAVVNNVATVAGKFYQYTITVTDILTSSTALNIIKSPAFPGSLVILATLSSPNGKTKVFSFVDNSAYADTDIYIQLASGAAVGDTYTFSISVRELPGNHAYQSVSANRPTLSARYNLLTNTGFSGAVAGSPGTAPTDYTFEVSNGATVSVVADADGNNVLTYSATSARQYIRRAVSLLANVTYTWSLRIAANSGLPYSQIFDVVPPTGAVNTYFANGQSVEKSYVPSAGDVLTIQTTMSSTAGAAQPRYGVGVAGSSTGTVGFWGADLRVANDGVGLPAYQRVNTSTDYDTVGFPPYLSFNGSNSAMLTNTITPGTDKAQVFVGLRKSSDAVYTTPIETGTSSVDGSITLYAPNNNGTADYNFRSRGTLGVSAATAAAFGAPLTNVITGLGDIAGDSAIIRVNGVVAKQTTTDQGTGNYLAYPLYIGARGGSSLWFNGRLYSLIVRFGPPLTATQIANTENWVNGKTKAY